MLFKLSIVYRQANSKCLSNSTKKTIKVFISCVITVVNNLQKLFNISLVVVYASEVMFFFYIKGSLNYLLTISICILKEKKISYPKF